jgi:hypothetical protein
MARKTPFELTANTKTLDPELDLVEDWAALHHPPPDNGCVVCGVGGDVLIGDTPADQVTWRCQGCNGLVCRSCTLKIPNSRPVEYYHATLCSIRCWERVGKPDE